MDNELLSEVMTESIRVTLLASMPLMLAGMIVGLIIAIFQATTSIQEQTLTFVPKIIAIVIALIIFGPWISEIIVNYTLELFDLIPDMARAVP